MLELFTKQLKQMGDMFENIQLVRHKVSGAQRYIWKKVIYKYFLVDSLTIAAKLKGCKKTSFQIHMGSQGLWKTCLKSLATSVV